MLPHPFLTFLTATSAIVWKKKYSQKHEPQRGVSGAARVEVGMCGVMT
jgi:hypothetical protein